MLPQRFRLNFSPLLLTACMVEVALGVGFGVIVGWSGGGEEVGVWVGAVLEVGAIVGVGVGVGVDVGEGVESPVMA